MWMMKTLTNLNNRYETVPAVRTLQRQCACGQHILGSGECKSCRAQGAGKKISISANPGPQEYPTLTPNPAGPPAVANPRPFTAVPTFAMSAIEGCRVPAGQHGVSKVLRFGIRDFEGRRVESRLTVDERFRLLEGPEELYRALTPNSYRTENGMFNDCYRLYSRSPLPGDLRMKVEQNHLVDGEVISKNDILYTPDNILVCAYPRPPRQRDFGARCRNF
jgi:hypothetical protein